MIWMRLGRVVRFRPIRRFGSVGHSAVYHMRDAEPMHPASRTVVEWSCRDLRWVVKSEIASQGNVSSLPDG